MNVLKSKKFTAANCSVALNFSTIVLPSVKRTWIRHSSYSRFSFKTKDTAAATGAATTGGARPAALAAAASRIDLDAARSAAIPSLTLCLYGKLIKLFNALKNVRCLYNGYCALIKYPNYYSEG